MIQGCRFGWCWSFLGSGGGSGDDDGGGGDAGGEPLHGGRGNVLVKQAPETVREYVQEEKLERDQRTFGGCCPTGNFSLR